jgi:hypothetical protein
MPRIKPPRDIEQRDISLQALALAKRAERAGLPIAAYLLDLAALETGADLTIRRFGPPDARQEP